MKGLNATVLLAGLVAVVLITVGAVVAIFLAGGPLDAQLARAGIVTAITGSVIVSLVTLLMAGRAEVKSAAAVAGTQANTESINGHTAELEAAQARIAYLEALPGGPSHPGPVEEQSHGV